MVIPNLRKLFYNLRSANNTFFANDEVVCIPDELIKSTTSDISLQLENFLKTCSSKKVIFPPNKTFTLERQLVLNNVKDMEIDFNNCTLKLPDGCTWKARYDIANYYVYESALGLYNCSNIKIVNLIIDGNKDKITDTKGLFGIVLNDVKGFICTNLYAKKINYHPIYVYKNTKNIKFYNTKFDDNGSNIINGKSEVYVQNNPDDDFSFYDTYVERSWNDVKTDSSQVFYINGYNGTIDRVIAKHVGSVFDCRIGTHFINNITVDTCALPFILQPNPNASAGAATSLYVKNIRATNCYGAANAGCTFLYIVGCNKAVIENIYLEATSDTTATYKWYGVRVNSYKSYENNPPQNVILRNVEIKGPVSSGIYISSIKNDIIVENVSLEGSGTGVGITIDSSTAYLRIKNYSIKGFNTNSFTKQTDKIIIDTGILQGIGTPLLTPLFIGQQYIDTVSKIAYISCGLTAEDWKKIT